jgi:hypothetical protein
MKFLAYFLPLFVPLTHSVNRFYRRIYTDTGNCKSLAVKALVMWYVSMDTEQYFILQNNYRTNYPFIPYKGTYTLTERPHPLVHLAQVNFEFNFQIFNLYLWVPKFTKMLVVTNVIKFNSLIEVTWQNYWSDKVLLWFARPFISDVSNLVTQIYIFETKFGSSTSNRIQ